MASPHPVGRVAAASTAILAVISFGIAIATPPRSGPSCTGDVCVGYPYTDIISFFPRDYLWMFPATLLVFAFLLLAASIHYGADEAWRPLTLTGVVLAGISAALIGTDYFIQLTVIQPSLLQGETDGLSLFSQYNPHGAFIALEALGYLLMCAAMGFLAPGITGTSRITHIAQWTFGAAALLTLAALVVVAVAYGHETEYRYEIAVISIAWTALIVACPLIFVAFGRAAGPRGSR